MNAVSERTMPTGPAPATVGKWLQDHGMGAIIVVDDLLDPPIWSNLSEETRTAFQGAIEEDITGIEDWLNERGLLPPRNSQGEEADDYLARLNDVLDTNPSLRRIWDRFFDPERLEGGRVVTKLVASLKALDGPTIHSSGIRPRVEVPAELSLIFLDYSLDTSDDDAAITILKDLYRDLRDLGKSSPPVVVLMSSHDLTEDQRQRVQNETNTMRGMFHGVNKSYLEDLHLYVLLCSIVESLDQARKLQQFASAINAAVTTAAKDAASVADRLSLEDYTYLQLLSLHGDGQPLGGYVLWLLSSYFARQLTKDSEVHTAQRQIDQLVFPSPPMESFGQSLAFVEAYQSAVFDVYDEEDYADLHEGGQPLDAQLQQQHDVPYVVLHFGDLFYDETKNRVHLVVTPECDLAFGGSRDFPGDRHVLFIPGELINIDGPFTPVKKDRPRTELFLLNGHAYRIEWILKQATTVALMDVAAWQTEGKATRRIARMQFAFAAEIQRAYAADLTRIGSPVTPPLAQSLSARIYIANPEEKPVQLGESVVSGAALILYSERFQKYILRDTLLHYLCDHLEEALAIAGTAPTEDEYRSAGVQETHIQNRRSRAETQAGLRKRQLQELVAQLPFVHSLRGPFEINKSVKAGEHITLFAQPLDSTKKATTVVSIVFETEAGPTDPGGMEMASPEGPPAALTELDERWSSSAEADNQQNKEAIDGDR